MLTSTKASGKPDAMLLSLQQSFTWRKPRVRAGLVVGKGKHTQAGKRVFFLSAKGGGYRKMEDVDG